MTSRQRFLAACKQEPLERPPVWIMRQAGRYLPEYRALREKYAFVDLVKNPDLATEITLQPLKRFPLDAAILFSDILIIPEAFGQPYHFKEEGGIEMAFTLDSAAKIQALDNSDIPTKLSYVGEALRSIRSAIGQNQALLGFGGSPWTLATYMVEGSSSKNFTKIKSLIYQHPALFEELMQKISDALIDLFKLQIESGADAIQIFDSWANICPATDYWNLSLKWIKYIIDALPKETPIILFAKGMSHHTKNLLKTGAHVLSLDWTVDMSEVCNSILSPFSIQGNMDPVLLNTTPKIVREHTLRLLNQMSSYHGYIFNLGHGILPEAKIENVEILVQTVTQYQSLTYA